MLLLFLDGLGLLGAVFGVVDHSGDAQYSWFLGSNAFTKSAGGQDPLCCHLVLLDGG